MGVLSVMIVEDDAFLADDLAEGLVDLGYDVVGTASGEKEADAILERAIPDVIIMDIEIEGVLDGVDLASKINQKLNIPIIFLTDRTDDRTVNRAQIMTGGVFLPKPVTPSIVNMNIKNLFQSKSNAEEYHPEYILLKRANGVKTRTNLNDIVFLKAAGAYCAACIKNQPEYTFSQSMNHVLAKMPNDKFIRVHRSYAVNLSHILSIENTDLIMDGAEFPVPIGANYMKELKRRVPIF